MFNSKVIEIPAEYQPRAEDLPGDLARIAAAIEEHRPGQGGGTDLVFGPGVSGAESLCAEC